MLFCTIVNHSIDKNIQKIHVDFFNNYYDLVVSALAAVTSCFLYLQHRRNLTSFLFEKKLSFS